ncbi:MAG: hypothetical protein Dbin4_02624 [Alphaproteobacteria bacterium]|nr:hypothetical protein [Alphaproteobacteria bacterium]
MNRTEFYQKVIGDMYDKVHAIGRRDALDEAWHLINAQGGYVSPGDLAGNAHNKAVLDALNIIEKLGGMDPLKRGKE